MNATPHAPHIEQTGRIGHTVFSIWEPRQRRAGASDVPVVLLHGASSSRRTWSPLLPALAGRDVIAVDIRGHGDSGFPDGRRNRAEVSLDVAAVLDTLEIGRAAFLGASLGAALSINLAEQRPDLAAGLVLEDPPLRAGTEPASFVEEMREHLARAAALSPAEVIDDVRKAMPLASDDEVRIVAEDRQRFDVRFTEYGLDWFLRPWREVFAEVACPITVLAGEPALGSVVTAVEEADCLRLLNAPSRFLRLPGAGHSIRRDVPAAYHEAVLAALDDIDRAERGGPDGWPEAGSAVPGKD
ncbi:alpha/beta hydrolase [Streptomyces sp. S3(2020)]|uniref:alpha/beta fold hydrolase n=1 Tax=Streptomyces sp. S3(2020) TaxID=2732044 RepID=UPI001488A5E4|nr:alpha/beta hydrolase [Streptomyces sp. S3(2020)]NNN30759.1 alpha/beta hydrolase [Streptomyces sp. S3(2020)]